MTKAEAVRKYSQETDNLKKAIDQAIDDMPKDSEVGKILRNNRAEVAEMYLEEYTEQYVEELHEAELEEERNRTRIQTERADRAEAERDHEKNKNRQNIITMLRDNLPDAMIIKYGGITVEELQKIKDEGF